jgi:DNA-binding transcriptional LysR family regulator
MQDPLVICCATKYRPKKRGTLSWDDLHGWPWLAPRKNTPTYVYLESLLFRHGLTFGAGSIESNSRNASAGILQAHPFLALLPRSYAQPLLSARVLYEVPLSTEGMLGVIKFVWDKAAVNPYNSIIIDAVQERVAAIRPQP